MVTKTKKVAREGSAKVQATETAQAQPQQKGPEVQAVESSQTIQEQPPQQKTISGYFIAGFIIILAIVATIIFLTQRQPQQQEDKVVATINGKPITLSQLDKLYDALPEQYKSTINKRDLLNQLIQTEVLYQEAEKAGFKVDEEKAKAQIEFAKMISGITEEQFTQKLSEQNTTENELIENYVKQLTIESFLNVSVLNKLDITTKEINDFYYKNKEQFKTPEQVTVKHILIGNKELAQEQQKEKAEFLRKEITTANFCDYVEKYSTDTVSIENCGEYTFTKNDPLVKEFKDLSFKQTPGRIGITQTQFGYHIIWTVKKTPARTTPLTEAKEQIKEAMTAQKAQQQYDLFYNELKDKNQIEINFDALETTQ